MKESIHNDLKHYTKLELTDALYRGLPLSLAALFLVVTMIVWSLYYTLEIKYLHFWYFVLCGIIVSRVGLLVWYNRTKQEIHLQKYHYYLFILGSSLTGLFLGILGSILMPDDITHQAFVIILITGLLVGSVQSLSASLLANALFTYLAIIPLLIWEMIQIYDNKTIFIYLFIPMFLLCPVFFVVARHAYTLLTRHVEMEYNYKFLLKRITLLKDKYKEQAVHDSLTGLYNHQFLNEFLDIEINRSKRKKLSIGIIMLDIDLFKDFNDTYGHECGDEILESLGDILNGIIRSSDIACRYGGEEFIILMPETTLDGAEIVAEMLRTAIKKIVIQREGKAIKNITVSLGVASYPQNGLSRQEVMEAVDKALYRAKQEGRDRVYLAS